MRVSQGVHADARNEIQVPVPVYVVDVAALPPVDDERITRVVLEQMFPFEVDDFLRG